MEIADRVRKLIEEEVSKNGYIIDEVLYVKEDGNYYLRIVIDKNGVIDIEDCVNVTRLVDPMLDNIDFIRKTLNNVKQTENDIKIKYNIK